MQQRLKTFGTAFILSVSLSVSTFHAWSKGSDIKPVWQSTPIKADGDNSDWPQPYPWYNEKSGIAYAVSNDKDNLYITFKANDDASKKSFLSGGVTIYIDTDGNKSQDIAIRFAPAGNARPQSPGTNDGLPPVQDGQVPPEDEMTNAMPTPGKPERSNKAVLPPVRLDITLQGFSGGEGRFPMGKTNPSGVMAAAGYDEYKALVWEAVIPFRSFFKNNLTAADAARKMSVGFVFTGMHAHMLGERPQTPDDDMPRAAGNNAGGHGSGRHGGGDNNGGIGNSGMTLKGSMPGADMGEADMPPTVNLNAPGAVMPEKTFRTWQKITLAWRE